MNQRKNIDQLSDGELQAFRGALQKMKNLPVSDPDSYQALAAIHQHCPHHSEIFIPWHRTYILKFEQALQKQDPSVTLPYWNWASTGGMPAACEGDASNPLWFAERSSPAARQGRPYPTQSEVDGVLQLGSYPEFGGTVDSAGHLESGPHSEIHDWVGLAMSIPVTATNDPVFWIHHGYVDNLWAQWQQTNSGTPSNVDQTLPIFNNKIRDVMSISTLGYEYVHDAVAAEFPGGMKASGSLSKPLAAPVGNHRVELRFEELQIMSKASARMEVTIANEATGQSVKLSQALIGFIMDSSMCMMMPGMGKGTLHLDITAALQRLFVWGKNIVIGVKLIPSEGGNPNFEISCRAVRLVVG
ncbi:MAG: tyrosinase family protein [Bryobacteraceae bacterium]|jgi:hypothetical protein